MDGRGRIAAGAAAIGVAVIALLLFRLNLGDRNQITSESIVMLGDSITEEGRWSDLFPDTNIVNEGHSGFTTAQLVPIARQVAEGRPQLVLILTGTNDIRDDHPPSWTIGHLNELLDIFATESPDTEVVVQTVLPRADRASDVVALNEAIVAMVNDREGSLLDTYRSLDDGAGGLRTEDTYDGIHLSDAGYARWVRVLRPFFDAGS